jgi:hypothetical protein
MNRALWAGTFGYYLPQMLGVSQVNETPPRPRTSHGRAISSTMSSVGSVARDPHRQAAVRRIARHVAQHVETENGAGSAIPRDTALKGFLLNMRELWRNNLSQSRGGSQRQPGQRHGGCSRDGWHFIQLRDPPSHGIVAPAEHVDASLSRDHEHVVLRSSAS